MFCTTFKHQNGQLINKEVLNSLVFCTLFKLVKEFLILMIFSPYGTTKGKEKQTKQQQKLFIAIGFNTAHSARPRLPDLPKKFFLKTPKVVNCLVFGPCSHTTMVHSPVRRFLILLCSGSCSNTTMVHSPVRRFLILLCSGSCSNTTMVHLPMRRFLILLCSGSCSNTSPVKMRAGFMPVEHFGP